MSDSNTSNGSYDGDQSSLTTRLAANPRPALRWAAVAAVLLVLELGAFIGGTLTVLHALVLGVTGLVAATLGLTISKGIEASINEVQASVLSQIDGVRSTAEGLPTLLSREVIPNQGHRMGPDGPWAETFMGLEPRLAWLLRVTLIVVYAFVVAYWLFRGWDIFRIYYRQADWTPTDDIINRLRSHRWGVFGVVIILLFLTMALFGPALGPTTVEANIQSPYGHYVEYYSNETGQVENVTVGNANFNSKSKGEGTNVGPMTYDSFDRFHPFGTLTNGRDLFTFMMGGARTTITVVGIAIGLSAGIAAALGMISAFYSGTVDLGVLTVADGITSVPQLLLLIMVSAVFAGHWITNVLNGGFLLAILFGLTGWPGLWRAVRGPALQVAQEEWVDAAESFGQRPALIMWKHMFPYVVGYLLVYASMSAGGIIIAMSALSFLGNGLGVTAPTPAWGRAIDLGQNYVSTPSWHISLIPGLMIVALVTGANALGDGLRDAIDPETDSGDGEQAAAGGGA